MAIANPSFDALATTTLKNRRKAFADNISNHIPFMKLMDLKNSIKLSGGDEIVKPLIHGFNTTSSSYSKMDTIDTSIQEGISAAKYDWKQVAATVAISGIERTLNGGKEKFLNLMEGKEKQAMISIENDISEMLMGDGTGNAGKDVLGLEAIIPQDPTTGTLGGIDSSTNSFWRNYYNTSVGSFASYGISAMSTAMRTLTRGTSKPDLIVTTPTIYGYLETVATGKAQFTNPKAAELGFEMLKFQGADVIFDHNCTSDRMYFINTDHLFLDVHKDKHFSMGKFIEPANQDGVVAKILFYGQLTTDRREALGVLSGFSA